MANSEKGKRKEMVGSVFHSPVRSVFDKFSKHKDVSLVFGDPIEKGNRSVIPVAKLHYTFGGGGGGGGDFDSETDEAALGKGEGAGGHINVKPIGVYEMTSKRVRFKPLYGMKSMSIILSVLTLGLALIIRKK